MAVDGRGRLQLADVAKWGGWRVINEPGSTWVGDEMQRELARLQRRIDVLEARRNADFERRFDEMMYEMRARIWHMAMLMVAFVCVVAVAIRG
jgi:hypothetical protein